MQQVSQENVIIDGIEFIKTTIITTHVTLSPAPVSQRRILKTPDRVYTLKEFLSLLYTLNPGKDPDLVRASFEKQLRRRIKVIKDAGLTFPCKLYKNRAYTQDFYIMKGTEPYLFGTVCTE